MTNIFMEKNFTFCSPYIYHKQKSESVYLILKINDGPFSETRIFQKFPQPQQQK